MVMLLLHKVLLLLHKVLQLLHKVLLHGDAAIA